MSSGINVLQHQITSTCCLTNVTFKMQSLTHHKRKAESEEPINTKRARKPLRYNCIFIGYK